MKFCKTNKKRFKKANYSLMVHHTATPTEEEKEKCLTVVQRKLVRAGRGGLQPD